MHNPAPGRLPSLDLLKGFEAAARTLSFTRAAHELHLTQSAVSRQMQLLEEQLGVRLFERRVRALALTEAGQVLFAAASQALETMRAACERLRSLSAEISLNVSTTTGFASLWLIPRLGRFARQHPQIGVRISTEQRLQDLDREGVDVAVRYCPAALAGAGAERLFGERVFPVCSPKLARDRARPLKTPADLERHVLLHMLDPQSRHPWLAWQVWLEAAGLDRLNAAGSLQFTGYDQLVMAAVEGHGIALGRSPLVRAHLRAGRLVAPFSETAESSRAYYVLASSAAKTSAGVAPFIAWLKREAAEDARLRS